MNEIDDTQAKINKLETIGYECGCEFYLPPLKNRNNPFYALEAKDAVKGSKLIMMLAQEDFQYKVGFEDNNQIIEVVI